MSDPDAGVAHIEHCELRMTKLHLLHGASIRAPGSTISHALICALGGSRS